MSVPVASSEKGSKLTYLVEIIGSLVVIIGFIYALKEYLSYWVQYAVFFALIIIIILIIYIFFSDIFLVIFNRMEIKRKHNEVARKHFDEFKLLVGKFAKFIESNNGITSAFNKLKSEEKYRYLRVHQLNEINNLLSDLNNFINRFDETGEDFQLLISQFENILRIYEKFYVKDTLSDIECVRQMFKDEIIPKNVKVEYKTRKDDYEKFIDKYKDFGEKVNSEYGSRVVYTYFELLEEL